MNRNTEPMRDPSSRLLLQGASIATQEPTEIGVRSPPGSGREFTLRDALDRHQLGQHLGILDQHAGTFLNDRRTLVTETRMSLECT